MTLLLLLGACSRPAPAPRALQPVAGVALDAGTPASAALPAPAPARFVGAAACAACHGEERTAWSHDWHARALSAATPSSLAGDFAGRHFRGGSSEAWMTQHGGRAWMRSRGVDGGLADFPVDWVVGGKRMQDALTTFPDGRWQILPVYFHVTGRAWVDYTEAKQGALTPEHPFYWTNLRRSANRECLDCHATGLQVQVDPLLQRWTTAMADPGVACEACHGPGSTHADTQRAADIFRPRATDTGASLAVCAQCHGPRTPLFPLLDAKHRFQPGQQYDANYQALVVTDGAQRSGDFFADGRPRTSSFEYQALLQSRCHRQGQATCLTCHVAPHAPSTSDELSAGDGGPPTPSGAAADRSCLACHQDEVARAQAHSHHRSPAAQSCTACHMPRVVTGVLDPFADHALDVPNPQNTARHGVPSACGLCHADRTPQLLQAQLLALWPDAGQRQERRTRLADAIDEATASASLPALRAVIADRAEAPTLRAAAAELLAQRFPAAAGVALLPLLAEPSVPLRAKAARALAAARDRASADALAGLRGDVSLSVRQAAAVALTLRGDPRGYEAVQALALSPESAALPVPHELLAQLLRHRGDTTGAAAQLEQALAVQPFAAETHVLLADLELQRGQAGLARAELEAALRCDPSHAGARERLARLRP